MAKLNFCGGQLQEPLALAVLPAVNLQEFSIYCIDTRAQGDAAKLLAQVNFSISTVREIDNAQSRCVEKIGTRPVSHPFVSGENASPSDQTSIRLNPDRIDADATVLRRRRTHEYRVRLPVPRSINKGLIAQLLSDTKRRVIVTVNNAGGAQQAEVAITPRYRGSKGFRGITFAVRPRDQRPAQLGHTFDGRLNISLKVRKTELTDIVA